VVEYRPALRTEVLFETLFGLGRDGKTDEEGSPRLLQGAVMLKEYKDDAYALLNPSGQGYQSIKKLSDSEILTLALFQQLRGIESERSFLRDVQRFFSHLFPGVAGMHPPPRSIDAFAGSGAIWSACDVRW